MTTYSRHADCTKGHRVELSFSWEPDGAGAPEEYSVPCPAAGCDGVVVGKLPVGADIGSLRAAVAP